MTVATRVALVTGCSRAAGLGFEICRQLGQLGFTTVLTARDAAKATALSAELRDQGLDVHGYSLDITQPDSVRAMLQMISERFGRLDMLINNATGATSSADPVSTADLEVARHVLDVTLLGTWRMTQTALPLLLKSDAGRIVNVSSSAGLHSDPALGLRSQWTGRPAYGIAKAALNALTVKFATELRDTDIKINAVCPGLTATYPGMAEAGARPVTAAARGIIWAATLANDGPSGGFYRDGQLESW